MLRYLTALPVTVGIYPLPILNLLYLNYLYRADSGTFTTVRTLAVIDVSQVVIHMDSIKFACLLTKFTTDAADGAGRFDILTLILGAAAHLNIGLMGYQFD